MSIIFLFTQLLETSMSAQLVENSILMILTHTTKFHKETMEEVVMPMILHLPTLVMLYTQLVIMLESLSFINMLHLISVKLQLQLKSNNYQVELLLIKLLFPQINKVLLLVVLQFKLETIHTLQPMILMVISKLSITMMTLIMETKNS